jgi:hypothetical protein
MWPGLVWKPPGRALYLPAVPAILIKNNALAAFVFFAQLLNATIWLAYKGTIEVFRNFPDIPNFGEFAMQEVVDKVMQTYGMMKTMSGEELEEAREVLLDFLSKRPGTDEHTATVESLTFLRNLKT